MAQQTRYYTESNEDREQPTVPTPPSLGDYDSGARQRQSELYQQIANRGPFQYNAKDDPLYGVMKDRYVMQGRMAMKDTMGQAAALTGGYGSSYGQAVGQQQYDASLQGLADVIPELYQAAYTRYADEGDRLQKAYALAGDEADRDYGRYRDAYGDWQNERAWQRQQEQDAYAREQDAYARQQNTYNQLYNLIMSTGYNPTDEELAAAGMTREQAQALLGRYALDNPEPGGGSGGRGGGGGSGGGSKKTANSLLAGAASGLTAGANGGFMPPQMTVEALRNAGASDAKIIAYLQSEGLDPNDFGYKRSGSGSTNPSAGRRTSQRDR